MALSVTRVTGDGLTRSFTFSFTGEDKGYLRNSDIEVTVDRAVVPFAFTSPNSLELDVSVPTPEAGAAIEIRRIMPKDKNYANFKKGSKFTEQNVNNSFLQVLYTMHELLDGYFAGNVEFQNDAVFLNDVVINGDLTLQDAFVEGVLSIIENTPDNPSSVMNLEGNDERYLRKSGDGMLGDLTLQDAFVEGLLSVIKNTPENQSSVMNIAGNDERYLRKAGGSVQNIDAGTMTVSSVGDRISAVINRGFADNRYYKNTGGRITGVVDATAAGVLTKDPTEPTSAVNKRTLDSIVSVLTQRIEDNQSGGEELLAAIAEAILEGTLETSANAPVIYHKRNLSSAIVVPEDCEARTFGSELTIEEGGSLYLGAGTEWRFLNDDGKTP